MFGLRCDSPENLFELSYLVVFRVEPWEHVHLLQTCNSEQQVWTLASRVDGLICFQSTFFISDAADFTVVVTLSGAELKHVDRHSGPDLLLSQAHAVIEDFEELLRLLLLVQLTVEGDLRNRWKQILA